ncbi:MAG: hypothetical protein U9R08_00955 [Nanoarchaeota archaeon]|nr:hypothetical protein [Nanoarchaeota archaeon]
MFSEVTTGNSFGITTGVESRDTAEDLGDALFYHDGVENCIYGIEEGSGDVFKFVTGTKVFTANVDTSFASGGEYLMGYNTSTDNLYYISGYNLYKQDGTTFSASLKTLPQGHEYKKMIEYKGFMAIFAEVEATGETRMFLYDVINEPATFEKTISLGYGFFIGAAVLNEAITVIVQNIKSKNSKENEGFT